ERINAFSGPGGYIYITRGLLKFVENQDELAGIIGHEIAHVCLRHAVKRLRDSNASLDSKEKLDELARFIVFQKYTAECEQEADKLGVIYTRKAGFDPNGLANFFERLYASQPRIISRGLFERFLQATIIGPERVKSIREYISQMETSERSETREKVRQKD
ncbi:MAG TPA: M48 family metalloprotease, partial [Candidatus Hypogeohydataceae bacterium YC40]